MPSITMYVIQPTTITQLSGCTLRRVHALKNPEEHERDHLHAEHASEIALKATHRRSHASRAPSAMSRPPVRRSNVARTRGRVSTTPRRSTNHAYAVSHTRPIGM